MHGLDTINAINSGAKLNKILRRNLLQNGHTPDSVDAAVKKVTRTERITRGIVSNRKARTGK